MAGSMFDTLVRIDCTRRQAAATTVEGKLASYIGGMGYGTKILCDEVEPTIDPLSEKNTRVSPRGAMETSLRANFSAGSWVYPAKIT